MASAEIIVLYFTRDIVEREIRWAKFSLQAPQQFVTPELQKRRHMLLVNLLKQLADLQKNIAALEFAAQEAAVLQERQETKAALKAMGQRFVTHRGIFYLQF